jgi:glucose-6-phosphate 1-dehydrogenase
MVMPSTEDADATFLYPAINGLNVKVRIVAGFRRPTCVAMTQRFSVLSSDATWLSCRHEPARRSVKNRALVASATMRAETQMSDSAKTAADALVIFGITGDLAKKMTFQALYQLEANGQLNCPIIGVAVEDWSVDHLRSAALTALEVAGDPVKSGVFDRLAARFAYVQGDFTDAATYKKLAIALKGASRPLYYLEIPPFLFAPVVVALGQANLVRGATVMIEKPFGHDLVSARALNDELHQVLDEDQILRVDHFLGKQPVADISYLRFANALFEPVWNRQHIAGVYVTMAENFGVQDRGGFYDPVGALRDVVQNHIFQIIALIAMEAPVAPGHAALWDKKVDVFRAMTSVDPMNCVRGQYDGYQIVPGVKEGSTTETFVSLRLEVNNWRWAGVPFFIRAGKEMAAEVTEVRVIFKRPPRLAFLEAPLHTGANQLIIRVSPEAGLRLNVLSKGADGKASRDVHFDLSFVDELGKPPGAYERLFQDALGSDHSLFTREDAVEETWRVLQPLIDQPPAVIAYARGSWGPAQADELTRGHAPWQAPWLPGTPRRTSS